MRDALFLTAIIANIIVQTINGVYCIKGIRMAPKNTDTDDVLRLLLVFIILVVVVESAFLVWWVTGV